jgi:hypothetical protein
MSMSEWRTIGPSTFGGLHPRLGLFPRGDELVPLSLVCLGPNQQSDVEITCRAGMPVCPRADQEHGIADCCVRQESAAALAAPARV